MGLKSTIANAVASTFAAIGDVKVAITYTAKIIGAYSPASDDTSVTETTYSINAVRLTSRHRELDSKEEPRTIQIVIKQADLSVAPAPEDTVTIGTEVYQVAENGIESDPADATWTLTLVRP